MTRRVAFLLASALGVGMLALGLAYWLRLSFAVPTVDGDVSTEFLRKEFHLDAAQAEQLERLDVGYRPKWTELARRLETSEERLVQLIEANRAMSPELDAALHDFERLRLEAQRTMLAHVYEVSRIMSPSQARRYVSWMTKRITAEPAILDLPDDGK